MIRFIQVLTYAILFFTLLVVFSSCEVTDDKNPHQTSSPKKEEEKTIQSKMDTFIYTIREEDNILTIAHDYNIRITDILSNNPNLDILLEPGQDILIPQKNKKDKLTHHFLLVGQNLHTLSAIYGVSVETILMENPNVVSGLEVGQNLSLTLEASSDRIHLLELQDDTTLPLIHIDSSTNQESKLITGNIYTQPKKEKPETKDTKRSQFTKKDNSANSNDTLEKTVINPELAVTSGFYKKTKHLVKTNESIEDILKKYHISKSDLYKYNPELEKTALTAGSYITIIKQDSSRLEKNEAKPKYEAKENEVLIKANEVLGLKRGMDIKYTQKFFSEELMEEKTYVDKKGLHKVVKITLPGEDIHSFDVFSECKNPARCIIQKIVIRDPIFVTPKGIKVGSTIKEIRKKYKKPTVTLIDGGVVILPNENKHIALVIEAFSIDWKANGEYDVKDIPDHLKIASIHVF